MNVRRSSIVALMAALGVAVGAQACNGNGGSSSGGGPDCTERQHVCDEACVDVSTSNCSDCGNVCAAGWTCEGDDLNGFSCRAPTPAPTPPPPPAVLDSGSDGAPPDAGGCGPGKVFTTIVPVGGVGTGTTTDSNIKLSADELSAYYSSDRTGTSHIYYATRASLGASFGAGAEVIPFSDQLGERWASPSTSGLYAIIERNSKIFESSRAATTDPWGMPTAPAELNQDSMAFPLTSGLPHLMPDGKTLYFSQLVVASFDIFKSTRTGTTWSTPVAVAELNVAGVNDWAPALTPDGLTMYFGSSRGSGDAGTGARSSIWVATRASANDPFGTPRKIAELDQGTDAFPSWVSADNCRLYFSKKVDLDAGPVYRSYVASQ